MITAERKPLSEIKEMIDPFRKILIAGCGSCVAECASGGEKEVGLLASQLRMDARLEGREVEIKEMTLDRQCVYEFIDRLTETIGEYDVVLSLGCGAGVQALADAFPKVHIVPGLNTTFIGETKGAGVWVENCRGCGDCKLGYFAAVCPVTRCAKGLFNGPCGGSRNGYCEVNGETPCAWQLIVTRLDEAGRLDQLDAVYPPEDWSRSQGRGPRRIEREDQKT
jgi:hypothetical protein